MTFFASPALANLARISKLKAEPSDARECAGLLRSAAMRLQDARQPVLPLERRVNLAFNVEYAAARLIAATRARGIAS